MRPSIDLYVVTSTQNKDNQQHAKTYYFEAFVEKPKATNEKIPLDIVLIYEKN